MIWICHFVPAAGFQYEPELVDGALDTVDTGALVLVGVDVDAPEEDEMVDGTDWEEEYAEVDKLEDSVAVSSSSSPVEVEIGIAVAVPVTTKLGEIVAMIPVPDG